MIFAEKNLQKLILCVENSLSLHRKTKKYCCKNSKKVLNK